MLQMRSAGMTVRQVAQALGLSPTTVQRRLTDAVAEVKSPLVEEWRAVVDGTLDAVQAKAFRIMQSAQDHSLALAAADRVLRAAAQRAQLHGLNAPVQVDARMAVVTPQEEFLLQHLPSVDDDNARELIQLDERSIVSDELGDLDDEASPGSPYR